MEISTILLISGVVLLIGISKSAFAGALGVFAVPLLMFKMPATYAIALMLPLLIIADAMSVKSFWKKWDTQLLIKLLPGALVGIVFSTLLLDKFNASIVSFFIGVICICFAVRNLFFSHYRLDSINSTKGVYLMSATSGITSTLVHAGGPPLIIYFTAIGLAPTKFVATAAAFFALMNVVKLVGAISLGLLSMEMVMTALAFSPLAFLGNWIGVQLHQRINKALFLKVMNYLLLILGLKQLYSLMH